MGHIGYGVRPSARGRGVATWALGRMLDEARTIGLERVLIVCDPDNIASATVIEHNGGALDGTPATDLLKPRNIGTNPAVSTRPRTRLLWRPSRCAAAAATGSLTRPFTRLTWRWLRHTLPSCCRQDQPAHSWGHAMPIISTHRGRSGAVGTTVRARHSEGGTDSAARYRVLQVQTKGHSRIHEANWRLVPAIKDVGSLLTCAQKRRDTAPDRAVAVGVVRRSTSNSRTCDIGRVRAGRPDAGGAPMPPAAVHPRKAGLTTLSGLSGGLVQDLAVRGRCCVVGEAIGRPGHNGRCAYSLPLSSPNAAATRK